MRPLALVLSLLAAAVLVPAGAAQETASGAPLVRLRDGHGSDLLFRVSPRTLRPVSRPIRTFRSSSGISVSPDGTRLASADGSRRRGRIQFVDLAGWRSMGVARLGRVGWFTVGWVSRDRVVAIAGEASGRQRLLWVDATTRKIVARRSLGGWTANFLPVPGGLALVLGPREDVGPLRIAILDPRGGIRTIAVDRIRAGAAYADRGQVLTPAVTVDPESGRLYVVAARGLLAAEVELASGAVAYHSLGATAAKGNIEVWWRHAAWAGDGRIAVTGTHWPRPRRGRRPGGPVPFGLRMIDTRSWTMRTLDARPDSMHVTGDAVLASGTRWFDGDRRAESTGLLGFDRAGRRAFTRFRGRQVALLGSRGHRGYVWVRRTRTVHVLDLRHGRTLREIRSGRRAPFLLSP
ncbi:MAG: hypothetical protein QOI32_1166 [Thermoleophilaceae bacterium]|nr:hypothetical protein [Thermoleophilaceae bacterium]